MYCMALTIFVSIIKANVHSQCTSNLEAKDMYSRLRPFWQGWPYQEKLISRQYSSQGHREFQASQPGQGGGLRVSVRVICKALSLALYTKRLHTRKLKKIMTHGNLKFASFKTFKILNKHKACFAILVDTALKSVQKPWYHGIYQCTAEPNAWDFAILYTLNFKMMFSNIKTSTHFNSHISLCSRVEKIGLIK